ncbi:hypothetical protein MNBD_PLANCTO03-110 [hydrothermal vent metagenome]|uniref:General secretion pathway GspH domain-containing protein n=1 Tax=hydrothermal vent metagenome TaxID=652676 RepID=A0A3B1E4X2_9ZZZZ
MLVLGMQWGRVSARKKRTMRRGAFTLIETMIVVLIVAAISAIFLPTIAARMTDSKLGHASRSIEAGAALAAAEAMKRSTIVAYVAEQWGEEWVLWAEDVEAAEVGRLLRASEPGADLPPDARETRREELASFSGVRLTDVLPPARDAMPGPGRIGGAGEEVSTEVLGADIFGAAGVEPKRYVLGVFFADGSCRAGPAMYLVAEDGTREVVRLQPLTGRVETRRLSSVSEEIEQLEEAEEAEPMVPMPEEPKRVPDEPTLMPGGEP